jgi:predicted MFS family arabinose efflux permease
MESAGSPRRNDAFTRLAVLSALVALGGGLLARLASDAQDTDPTAQYRLAFLVTAVLAATSGLIAVAITESPRRRSGTARSTLRWPRRSWPLLWRLGLTNCLNGTAAGVFAPFVAYWFSRRFGAGPGQVGTLFAVVNAVTVATIATAGPLSRRYGLVSTVIVSRLLQGLLLIPMALAPSFAVAGGLYCLRMAIARIGLPLRQSFVVAMAHPDERASVAAMSVLPMQATNSASPLLAGYLFEEVSLAAPFELGGALQAVAALLWGMFFRRAAVPGEQRPAALSRPPGGRPRTGRDRR